MLESRGLFQGSACFLSHSMAACPRAVIKAKCLRGSLDKRSRQARSGEATTNGEERDPDSVISEPSPMALQASRNANGICRQKRSHESQVPISQSTAKAMNPFMNPASRTPFACAQTFACHGCHNNEGFVKPPETRLGRAGELRARQRRCGPSVPN